MANSNPTGKPISTKLCYRYLRFVGTNESTHSWSWVYSVEGWSHSSFRECGHMDYGSFVNGLGIKRKIEGKDRKGTTQNTCKNQRPSPTKKSESSKKHEQVRVHMRAHVLVHVHAHMHVHVHVHVSADVSAKTVQPHCGSGALKSSPLSSQCRTVGRRRVLQDLYSRNFVCLCSGGWPDHGIWELVHPLSFQLHRPSSEPWNGGAIDLATKSATKGNGGIGITKPFVLT